MISKVGIIGLGALGILFAAQFQEKTSKSQVYILADEKRLQRYRTEGVYCNGRLCDFQYASPADAPQMDLLIFATKYQGLPGAVKTAAAEGISLTEKELKDWVALVDTLSPQGEPSMRQDTKAGRETEVELFAGVVCRLGKKHCIPTPENDYFYKKLPQITPLYRR